MRKYRKLKDEMKCFDKLCQVMRGEHVEQKQRKKRSIETKKRDMAEKMLERKIINELSLRGCGVAKSGEQSTYNSQHVMDGMSDLIIFCPLNGIIFMEVKTEKRRHARNGGLRDTQVKFRDLVIRCGGRHAIVYNLNEALNLITRRDHCESSSLGFTVVEE